jgi:hypothetical protein
VCMRIRRPAAGDVAAERSRMQPIAGFGVTVLLPFVARPPPVKDTVALGSAPVLAE